MKCRLCGRFMVRLWELGTTGFLPDHPDTASSIPYAPFACWNLVHDGAVPGLGRVQYERVGFEMKKP